MIIVPCNLKGGVSKTTTSLNLAAALIERGKTVQLWDTDTLQCDLMYLSGLVGLPCKVPTAFNLSSQISSIEADFHIIDTPGRNDPAMRRALLIADYGLVTIPAEALAIRGSERLYEQFGAPKTINSNVVLKSVVTLYTGKYSAERKKLYSLKDFSFCKTVLYRNKAVHDAPLDGKTVLTYAPHSQAARAYRSLAKEIDTTWTP